jgi:hypothetical protein
MPDGYRPPPENPEAEARRALVWTFARTIQRSPGVAPELLARRLLADCDIRGWKPEEYRAARLRERWQDGEQPAPEVAVEGIAAVRAALAQGHTSESSLPQRLPELP